MRAMAGRIDRLGGSLLFALFAAFLVALTPAVARAHGDLAIPTEKNAAGSADDQGPDPELDVEPGVPAPAGYHLARRPRKAAIIGGGLLFVASYALAFSRAFQDGGGDCDGCDVGRQHRLFVPVAGPFLFAFGCDGCGSRVLWATDGVVQALGAALVVYGLVPHTVWALGDTAEVGVVPVIGARNSGLSVIATF